MEKSDLLFIHNTLGTEDYPIFNHTYHKREGAASWLDTTIIITTAPSKLPKEEGVGVGCHGK